jgi:hypothetical protein
VSAEGFSRVSQHTLILLGVGTEDYVTEVGEHRDEGIEVGMDVGEYRPLHEIRVGESRRSECANPKPGLLVMDPIPKRMVGVIEVFIVSQLTGTLAHHTDVEEDVEERFEVMLF